MSETKRIAIIGSPNSGKSLLFNRITGLHHKAANFPGITVGIKSGRVSDKPQIEVIDFPGVYSLHTISAEEQVAVDAFYKGLDEGNLDAVICLLDSTRLEKGLVFALQIIEACKQFNKPLLIAANMADVLANNNLTIDEEGLAAQLGVPVLPVSAKTGAGVDALIAEAEKVAGSAAVFTPAEDNQQIIARDAAGERNYSHQLAEKFGPRGDILLDSQTRLDRFFLHSWTGGVVFLLIMYLLFQSIFTWAAPAMDAVEELLMLVSSWVIPLLPKGMLQDFVQDALFGGIGAFLVFVPQIFVLTLVVGILEDSGYLARAATICHKPLRFFGLTGKSFIPMLSGVACAIPGIYAARTIDSPKKRWLTYLAIPLMPCSARLPVYTLLIAAFIPANKALGGLVGWQGLAMFAVYLFGIVCGLLITSFVSRSNKSLHSDLPFILEMPPYRMPLWKPLLRNAVDRSIYFVQKAGSIIFTVTVIIWLLGYFPNGGESLDNSFLGHMGRLIAPIFEPFGLDWRYGVAILTSFLAREVFVGTLGTLFGIEGADENVISLAENIQNSGLPIGAGLALLVFFAIALQCVSTMAVLRREVGSWRLPIQMFIAYSFLAYGAAWLVFHLSVLLASY